MTDPAPKEFTKILTTSHSPRKKEAKVEKCSHDK